MTDNDPLTISSIDFSIRIHALCGTIVAHIDERLCQK